MHVCSYCSGTGRKLVPTSEYEIEKSQPDADPKFIVLSKDVDKTDRFMQCSFGTSPGGNDETVCLVYSVESHVLKRRTLAT